MARFAYGRHTAKVAIGSYPDDDSYPIGTNEWNEDINNLGMLGFTSVEGTCATNVVTLTGNAVANTGLSSVIRVDGQGDAADDLDGIAITDTNEYDLLYLFAENSGRAITVQHASGNVSTGKIYLLAGTGTKVLSTTTPMLVIRKGNDWYEYGGGAQTTPTDITVADTTDTTCFPSLFESATGDLAPKTDADLTYNAGNATLTATTFTGALTGNASTATALATARNINGVSFDGPVLNKFTGSDIKIDQIRDTMIESQLFDPNREHNLKSWGNFFKHPKGEHNDFTQYSEQMLRYCYKDTAVTKETAVYLEENKDFSSQSYELERSVRSIIDQQQKNGFAFDIRNGTLLLSRLQDELDSYNKQAQEKGFEPYKKNN